MGPTLPLPPRHVHLPLTPLAELIVELDVVLLRALPERRFFVRALCPGEFDRPVLAGDEHGKPHHANAIIVDRTRPGLRIGTYIGEDETWPQTDRDILALLRRGGCAV